MGLDRILVAALHRERQALDVSDLRNFTADRWDALLSYAGRQRVRPLLHRRLASPDVRGAVPDGVLKRLTDECRDIARRNLRLMTNLREAVGCLDEHGIEVIVLKGPHLVLDVYRDAGLREISDLDLLVPEEKAVAAFHTLTKIGYRPRTTVDPAAQQAVRHELPQLVRTSSSPIEIHWTITNPQSRWAVNPRELWRRARPLPAAGGSALGLEPTDLLLHLAWHAGYHHLFDFGLRPFCDIDALVHAGTVDWEEVVSRTRATRWQKGTYLTLRLARELFGTQVPERVVEHLQPASIDDRIVEAARAQLLADASPSVTMPVDIAEFAGGRPPGVRILAKRLFVGRAELAVQYPWIPPRLIGAGYLLRPLTLLRRYGRLAIARQRGEDSAAPLRRQSLARWLES